MPIAYETLEISGYARNLWTPRRTHGTRTTRSYVYVMREKPVCQVWSGMLLGSVFLHQGHRYVKLDEVSAFQCVEPGPQDIPDARVRPFRSTAARPMLIGRLPDDQLRNLRAFLCHLPDGATLHASRPTRHARALARIRAQKFAQGSHSGGCP